MLNHFHGSARNQGSGRRRVRRVEHSPHSCGHGRKSWRKISGGIGAYYQGDADARTQDFQSPSRPRPQHRRHHALFQYGMDLRTPRFTQIDNSALRTILGSWQISGILLARTGVPVQLSQAGTGLNVSRPDYVGGQAILGDYKKTLLQHLIWCPSIPSRASRSGPETSATMQSANPAQ